ncbi:plasmid partitioning protein RepB [Paenirhodobacter enshiensis]|uniref:plasmid partitioning protein RepB n=1 Tax=Paenirhodobacter enshiensis TaxID=1105367 RepID=UPI003FA1E530
MARKHLLDGLMTGAPAAPEHASESPLDPGRPRFSKGAIGAISRSVADLQARALIEIDPTLIDAGGMQDRLDSDDAEDAALRDSIAEYGQQVPVLVRPHPTEEGRYQIVYGRRRVLALRELGRPVKALLRQLDDRDLLLAQGQENTARRDLSFIEKANFARQMTAAGYDRKIVGDTLSMDKTLISRLLSVTDRVPEALIVAIGAAPSVGRDRWLALAEAIEASALDTDEIVALVNTVGGPSDSRFEEALRRARGPRPTAAPRQKAAAEMVRSENGIPLARIERKAGRLTLQFEKKLDRGFEDWLISELPALHARWGRKD